MKLQELQTPAILVRKNILERNLTAYQSKCDQFGKRLWPMVKTHKSTELGRRQAELGADGFLCGTLDECETLCEEGFENIMYAYPVAGKVSCRRAALLAKKMQVLCAYRWNGSCRNAERSRKSRRGCH